MNETDRFYEIRTRRIESEIKRLNAKYISSDEFTIEIRIIHDFARVKLRTYFLNRVLEIVAAETRTIPILADELRKATNEFFRLISVNENSQKEIEKRIRLELKKISEDKKHESKRTKRARGKN